MKIQRPKARLPIPPDAKQVFKGVIFDVYQWQQKMFDGSESMYEKVKRKDTVSIIAVTEDEKVIVIEQEQSGVGKSIGLPGGRVENGEDVLEGAKRELSEETGYGSDDWTLWDAVQLAEKTDWASYTFIAKSCALTGVPRLDAGEKVEVMLKDFDEFLEMLKKPDFRDTEVILKLLKDGFMKYEFNRVKMNELRKLLLS